MTTITTMTTTMMVVMIMTMSMMMMLLLTLISKTMCNNVHDCIEAQCSIYQKQKVTCTLQVYAHMMPTKLNTLEHRRHGYRAMRSVARRTYTP